MPKIKIKSPKPVKNAKQRVPADVNYLVPAFDLEVQKPDYSLLNEWIQPVVEHLDDFSEALLQKIEPSLRLKIGAWYEEDLKMKFLSFIFLLAELEETGKVSVFYERILTKTIAQKEIYVIADCVVSSVQGFSVLKTPYFFLQEFKKSKGDDQDAEGQMLGAMLVAQDMNQNGKPLYGAYVMGEHWYFSVLNGRDYAKSDPFALTKPKELRQVINTLRYLKDLIFNKLAS
jgi:hypothetical protein